MSQLHITEYPHEISREALARAMSALGFSSEVCRSVTLTLDGFEAELLATDLAGRTVGWVTVYVPCRPGVSK